MQIIFQPLSLKIYTSLVLLDDSLSAQRHIYTMAYLIDACSPKVP